MALSRTTGILAVFVLGLSAACIALLVTLLVTSNQIDNSSNPLDGSNNPSES